MRKFVCLSLVLVLTVSFLCGCSLFSAEETDTETVQATAEETTSTEAPTAVPWGECFAADGSMQEIGYVFITSVFPDTWKSLFSCETSTTVTKWGIGAGSEEDNIRVYVTCAVYTTDPTEADTSILTQGNYQAGKEDYEGALIVSRYFSLQQQSDGTWQCVNFGLSW